MKILQSFRDVAGEPVTMAGAEGATRRLLLGPADGAPNFALRVFSLAPGGFTPDHQHPFEHENLILEGRGLLRTADRDVPLAPGMVILILPGEQHQFRAAAEEGLSFVCLVPNAYA